MSSQPPPSGASEEPEASPAGEARPSHGVTRPTGDEQPSYGTTDPSGPPAYGSPSFGSPSSGTPDYGAPDYGAPDYGTPDYGASAYGASTYEASGYGAAQPGFGTGQPTPLQQPGQASGGQPGWARGPSGWGGPGSSPAGYGYPGGQGGAGGPRKPGFLATLFDLSFTSFVTPSIVKGVYVVAMAVIALGWLGYTVAFFARGAGWGLLMLLVIGPVVSLVYLILARIGLELYLAVIRVAEDVRELRDGARPASPGPTG